MDETLRLWGRNIASRRQLLRPDGTVRTSPQDGTMSQADLGAKLNPPVNQSTVARWEAGQMEPRRRYKAQLASTLMADVSMIFPLTRSVTS